MERIQEELFLLYPFLLSFCPAGWYNDAVSGSLINHTGEKI